MNWSAVSPDGAVATVPGAGASAGLGAFLQPATPSTATVMLSASNARTGFIESLSPTTGAGAQNPKG